MSTESWVYFLVKKSCIPQDQKRLTIKFLTLTKKANVKCALNALCYQKFEGTSFQSLHWRYSNKIFIISLIVTIVIVFGRGLQIKRVLCQDTWSLITFSIQLGWQNDRLIKCQKSTCRLSLFKEVYTLVYI